ncbi:hypothetical protein ACSFBM_12140 [Variovorax sp. GB1R11]|uniref:hypothetical protein n=1 Tax=Variovorax sp. GB1R11 TaxID=3443741 RepID=UPI003F47B028
MPRNFGDGPNQPGQRVERSFSVVADVQATASKTLTSGELNFQVFSTPDELRASIAAKNMAGTPRVVVGYCWA